MIVKSSSRSGGVALADHLTNQDENETVRLSGSRGLTSDDPHRAITCMIGMQAGWRGKRPLCHAHISPGQAMSEEDWKRSWEAFEREFELEGRPYVEVEHVKRNERVPHRHRAYLRVDFETQRANDDSYSKIRDEKISRLLEHDLGHSITPGPHGKAIAVALRSEGRGDVANWLESQSQEKVRRGRATTWEEHQQNQRARITREELGQRVADAWTKSDTGQAFRTALEAKGFIMARGDNLDMVIVDSAEDASSPARLLRIAGMDVRAREMKARLADIDLSALPSVAQAKEMQRENQRAAKQTGVPPALMTRPDEQKIAERRSARAQEAAKAREQRAAEQKEQLQKDRESLWEQYQQDKAGLKAGKKPARDLAWQIERAERERERQDLKQRLADQRRLLRLVVPPGLRFLAMHAHKAFVADGKWADLKERQAQRWKQAAEKMGEQARGKPWRQWVQELASFGDPRAKAVLARQPKQRQRGEPAAWVDLPGLDVRSLGMQEKDTLKERFGLRWDRTAKVWQAPADHPEIATARAQWQAPAPPRGGQQKPAEDPWVTAQRVRLDEMARAADAAWKARQEAQAARESTVPVEIVPAVTEAPIVPPASRAEENQAAETGPAQPGHLVNQGGGQAPPPARVHARMWREAYKPETQARIAAELADLSRPELRETLVLTLKAERKAERDGSREEAGPYRAGAARLVQEAQRRAQGLPALEAWREAQADYSAAIEEYERRAISSQQLERLEVVSRRYAAEIAKNPEQMQEASGREQRVIDRHISELERMERERRQKSQERGGYE